MLSQVFRVIVVNKSGQLLTYNNNGRINLKVTRWFITPGTGKIDYTQESDDDCGFITASSLANGSEILSVVEYDNRGGNLYLGAQVQLEITHDEGAAADGTFDLYLDGGDAPGELASDGSGYASAEANKLQIVGSLTWESNGQDDELMRSPVFNI